MFLQFISINMSDNILNEVRISTLLRIVMCIALTLGAAPVRLRRARSHWLLAACPRRARSQRLLCIAICTLMISAMTVFSIITQYNIRPNEIFGKFGLPTYIMRTEQILAFLAYIVGAICAPGRTNRVVSILQQIQQIAYRLDNCGVPSVIQTQRSNIKFVKGYIIWQLFVQFVNLGLVFLQIWRDQYWKGFIYSLVYYYMNIVHLMIELQWTLTIIEIHTAIVKLNKKIEDRLRDFTLSSINGNFRLQFEFPLCYEIVCDTVRQLNKKFGATVLLTFMLIFLRILIILADMITTLTSPTFRESFDYYTVARDIALGFTLFLKLLILVEPCHWTQYEVKQTTGKASCEIDQFLRVVQLRDAKFSPMGVFRVSRSVVTSMIGSLVTYLVIFIQMQN